jgi:enamine deaminase RidA (YjgF/YER057c/UK114 family)
MAGSAELCASREVKHSQSILYCSGQAAVHADGQSSSADMRTQLIESIQNLEKIIITAGYELKDIARLNIYTTSTDELFTCFDVFQNWIAKHGIKQASTLLEVKGLFETLKVELEATVIK